MPSSLFVAVITLQNTSHKADGKLDAFNYAWETLCGTTPQFEVCPGVMDARRGVGIATALERCLSHIPTDAKYVVIFEDDARPQAPAACRLSQLMNHHQRFLPPDSVLQLGGHHVDYSDNLWIDERYRLISHSFGAYAMAFSLETSLRMRAMLQTLLKTSHKEIDHDVQIAKQFETYLAYPTLFGHHGGYSATWDAEGETIWQRKPPPRWPWWELLMYGSLKTLWTN